MYHRKTQIEGQYNEPIKKLYSQNEQRKTYILQEKRYFYGKNNDYEPKALPAGIIQTTHHVI